MKICTTCKESKPLTEYHANRRSKDGKSCTCKGCKRDKDRSRYESNADAVKARVRAYQAAEGKAVANGCKAEYKKRHPKKARAHQLVRNALRRGELTRQPCEACGTSNHVIAHHGDYDQPLAVRWLCEDHHKEWHRINGEAKNPC